MRLEVQHCKMFGVWAADDEGNGPPIATFRDEDRANEFVDAQRDTSDEDRINVDLCVLPCRVELVFWNSYDEPGDKLERAARALGHDDWSERQAIIEGVDR